jgi:hypothetical protein
MEPVPASEELTLPRWLQVVVGLLLLPFSLLCLVGAVSIFGIPKVQGDPLLQLVAGVICALCLWVVVLAARLIFGLRGKYGFMGPVALRIGATVAIGLVIGGAFTGVYVEHPVRSVVMAVVYIVVSIGLWRLATYKSRRAAGMFSGSAKPPGSDQAVIVHFDYGSTDLQPIFELEQRLIAAITRAGAGELDGNEVATDGADGYLYMYGPDADALFAVARPVLDQCVFMRGARVRVRYGPPADGVREVQHVLSPPN